MRSFILHLSLKCTCKYVAKSQITSKKTQRANQRECWMTIV